MLTFRPRTLYDKVHPALSGRVNAAAREQAFALLRNVSIGERGDPPLFDVKTVRSMIGCEGVRVFGQKWARP